ncbi:hypothetical protein MTR_5g090590 [Medicago truncatula]|uniref:Uncharacterized protein n=1 Tax=Medicago truncatula TaxID=3880 RepID=G7K380_MEDTR|nr:hypothetical protein MTR_5g090590 [Medicago truncatula]
MALLAGMKVRLEFIGESNSLLTADKIERGIKSVLYKDGEVRKKVQEISETCKKTRSIRGRIFGF